jgi:hypothetical protein
VSVSPRHWHDPGWPRVSNSFSTVPPCPVARPA